MTRLMNETVKSNLRLRLVWSKVSFGRADRSQLGSLWNVWSVRTGLQERFYVELTQWNREERTRALFVGCQRGQNTTSGSSKPMGAQGTYPKGSP